MAAPSVTANTWVSRDWAGTALRLAIVIAPTVVATIVVFALLRITVAPTTLLPALGRLLGIALAGFAVASLVNRLANRLLPLAALLKLSLAFPDQAPSRFKLAIRASSSRSLAREIESAREGGLSSDATLAAEQILLLTTAVGEHDRRTRGHSERVRVYARMLGEQLDIEGEELEKLQWGALLHDIGKITVPPEILNKVEKLESHEWEILKGHPAAGGRLIAPVAGFLGPWALASQAHHEKYDGTGYPLGLAGSSIPLAGRIVAVADAYEVMTATRSYKTPMTAEEARAELTRSAGTHFDPDAVRAFLTLSTGQLNAVRGPFAWLANIPFMGPIVASGTRLLGQVSSLPAAAVSAVPASAATAGAMTVAAVGGAVAPPPPVELAAVAPDPKTAGLVVTTTTESLSATTVIPSTTALIAPTTTESMPSTTAPTTSTPTTTATPSTTITPPTTLSTTTTAPSTTGAPTTETPTSQAPTTQATTTTTQAVVESTTTTTTPTAARQAAPPPPPPAPVFTVLTGNVVEITDAPADLSVDGDYRSNDTLFFYDEGQTTLTESLRVGLVQLPAGSTVCSYYFMLAPVEGQDIENDIELTFNETVLAIATTDQDLDRSDVLTIPGTTFEDDRELELLIRQDVGDFEGNTVSGRLTTSAGWVDSARIITDCS